MTLSIVDLRQTNEGHVLVLPKLHFETLDELPPSLFNPLMSAVVRMTRAVRRCFAPDGINVWQSNGIGAAQEVRHIHFHVFPRKVGDGHFAIYPGTVRDSAPETLDRLAARLRTTLSREDA